MTSRPLPAESPVAKPYLKSAGGKTALLPKILPRLPAKIRTYYEPFLGGGAVFFALAAEGRFERAILGDANEEFAHTYRHLARDVDGVIRALKKHVYEEEHYYAVRAQEPLKLSPSARAARLIFLNKTCFNGLYRVNRKGQFNVPFGRYTNPTICDEENLRAVAAVLRKTALVSHADFAKTVETANRGDVVYFDCPYWPVSASANFNSYTKDGFTSDDQTRLRNVARRLKRRGVHVLLSNADVRPVRTLYTGFTLHSVSARRNINSTSTRRGLVDELLIT